jgi:hypothetical protein
VSVVTSCNDNSKLRNIEEKISIVLMQMLKVIAVMLICAVGPLQSALIHFVKDFVNKNINYKCLVARII